MEFGSVFSINERRASEKRNNALDEKGGNLERLSRCVVIKIAVEKTSGDGRMTGKQWPRIDRANVLSKAADQTSDRRRNAGETCSTSSRMPVPTPARLLFRRVRQRF